MRVLEPSLSDATRPTTSRTLRVMDEHVEDFAASFEKAGTDEAVQQVHEDLVETIERAVTRSFRPSFLFCALLAALALVPIVVFRKRWVA
jgi:hypothetical protein